MLLLNHPEFLQFIFFQEILHTNSQTIHVFCFSQYQKYIFVKYCHCEPIHIKRYFATV